MISVVMGSLMTGFPFLAQVDDEFAVDANLESVAGMDDGGCGVFGDDRRAVDLVPRQELLADVKGILRSSVRVADVYLGVNRLRSACLVVGQYGQLRLVDHTHGL